MQIDRHNLSKHFDTICEHLNRASFVSFDCEFTGLVTNIEKIEAKFADHQEFYQRIKQTALNFKILQFGLTAFVYNENNSYYEPFAYNFYTLPYVNLPGFNNIMISEVESLAFLSEHGIDWNRIFKDGIIPQRLIQPFQYQRHHYDKNQRNQDEYFFSPEDKKIIDSIQKSLQRISEKRVQDLVDFKKKSIYSYFLSKYSDKLALKRGKKTNLRYSFIVGFMGSIHDDKNDDIVFKKEEKTQKYVQNQTYEQKMDIEVPNHSIEALLKIISDRQIPIVGHFPNLDIGLIYHTYLEPLPEKYEVFTQRINKFFPYIYDTKVFSRRVSNHFKGMKVSLGNLYSACQQPRYLKNYCNVIQSKQVKESNSRHEAGYDSYLTGFVFVGMANWILQNDKGAPLNFKGLQDMNGLIYSRQTGEISLRQPYFPATLEYIRKILILNEPMSKNEKLKQIAQKLSVYGTLFVTEDHGQTYFVFEEENQKIQQIFNQLKQEYGLRNYNERKIPRARDSYSRCQEQLYYNQK